MSAIETDIECSPACLAVLAIPDFLEMILSFLGPDQHQLCNVRLAGRAWARAGARRMRRVFYSFRRPPSWPHVKVFTHVKLLHVKIADFSTMLPAWEDFALAHEFLELAALQNRKEPSFLTCIRGRNARYKNAFLLNVRFPVEMDKAPLGPSSNMIEILAVPGYQLTLYKVAYYYNSSESWISVHDRIYYEACNFRCPSDHPTIPNIPYIEAFGASKVNHEIVFLFVLSNLREMAKRIGCSPVRQRPFSIVYADEDVAEFFPDAIEVRPGARALWAKIRETRELWRCNEPPL